MRGFPDVVSAWPECIHMTTPCIMQSDTPFPHSPHQHHVPKGVAQCLNVHCARLHLMEPHEHCPEHWDLAGVLWEGTLQDHRNHIALCNTVGPCEAALGRWEWWPQDQTCHFFHPYALCSRCCIHLYQIPGPRPQSVAYLCRTGDPSLLRCLMICLQIVHDRPSTPLHTEPGEISEHLSCKWCSPTGGGHWDMLWQEEYVLAWGECGSGKQVKNSWYDLRSSILSQRNVRIELLSHCHWHWQQQRLPMWNRQKVWILPGPQGATQYWTLESIPFQEELQKVQKAPWHEAGRWIWWGTGTVNGHESISPHQFPTGFVHRFHPMS